MKISIDIETRSGYDIKKCGVYKYVEHPDFKILIACLDIDGKRVEVDFTKDPIPEWWRAVMTNPNIEKWAYNAQFERICISKQLGIEYIDPAGWYCKMVHCYGNGASGTLAGVERLFNNRVIKNPIGSRLIKKFCNPPYAEPAGEDWELFKKYCHGDVDAEMSLKPDYNKFDHELYIEDQRINDRGLQIDIPLVKKILAATKKIQAAALKEAQNLGLINPNSNPQKKAWFKDQGHDLPNVKKETLKDLKCAGVASRMIELLNILGSATVKKYQRMLDMEVNGRIRGMYTMLKQHCFRWSGNGVQVHNLSRGYATEEEILEAIKNIDSIEKAKNLVRGCFIGNFTVADFSGIEARVLAWVCGFDEKLTDIRNGTDLYVKNAARLYNIPYEAVTKKQRTIGKTMELALGYQGWVQAMIDFGADKLMPEPEIKAAIKSWRLNNKAIVDFWDSMEQTAKLAITHKTAIRVNDYIFIKYNGKDMLIGLPSGHNIVYKDTKLEVSKNKTQISYKVNNGNLVVTRYTWGGKLTENVVQAIAWTLLRNSILNVNKKYRIVGHVHDEILVEHGDLDRLIDLMVKLPSWGAGLPLNAEGWTGNRYRKG